MPLLRLKLFLLPPFTTVIPPGGLAPRLFLSSAYSSRSSPSLSASSIGSVSIEYEQWSGLQSWRESPINEDRFWGQHGPRPMPRSQQPLPRCPGEAAIASASSLAEMGAVVLSTSDPALKSQLSHLAFSRWRSEGLPVGIWEPPDKPSRPPKPHLVSHKEIPAPKDSGLPLNAYMLHNLAHVELNAIDLAWDTVVRFSPFLEVLGEGFFADFAHVADDESRHFGWCSQRLMELGFRYGDMPAHNMLWKECEKSSDDVAARLAVIPMVQEARRLNAGHGLMHELSSIGDLRTSELLTRIIDEDFANVTVGFHWLRHVKSSHRPSLKDLQSTICLGQISLEHVDQLLCLLKKCGRIISLHGTKLLHALTIVVGPYSPQPIFLYNNIISFYVDLGKLETGRTVFDNMPERNVVSYNSIICAYSRSGNVTEAFRIFRAMRGHGFSPTQHTLSALLSSEELDLSCGIQLQGLIWKNGSLSSGPFVGTSLLNLYGRYGFLDEVNAIFEDMLSRSLITWNSVITWFGKLGLLGDCVRLYKSLVRVSPNLSEGTFIGVLSGCVCENDMELGEQFHGLVVKSGWNSTPVANALINLYDKCGNVFLVERMFEGLDIPDIVSWNIMIGVWAKSETPENALSILCKMSLSGLEPNQTTFASSVNAAIGFETPRYGEYVHGKLIKTPLEMDVFVGCSLVDFYAKFDRLEDAHRCFDNIQVKNVISWNALISGYSSRGSSTSVKLLQEMLSLGFKPDESSFSASLKASTGFQTRQLHCTSIKMGHEEKEYVLSSLIISYARNGLISDALAFVTAFDEILSVGPANVIAGIYNRGGQFHATIDLLSQLEEPDPVSWNIVIEALARGGNYAEVIKVFKYMNRFGIRSDKYTFVSLLTVCSKLSDLGFGASIHGLMIKTDFSRCDSLACNILMDMYGKCGCLSSATKIFERMIDKNLISWTVLINSLGMNGCANEALKRFREMELLGFKPDGICISAVQTACRHGGLVEEGMELFHQMHASSDVELEVDHYNCVVSLLARSGSLKEAEEIIKSMPFPPNSLTWRSFLEGSKMHSKSRPPSMETTSPMEARGLDAGPRLVQKLVGFGDNIASKIVAKIADEETAHVSVGVDWFIALCRRMNLPPCSTFKELLREYNVELKGPFNHLAREKAGIPRDWYDPSSTDKQNKEQQQLSVVHDRLACIIAMESENSSLNRTP